MENDDKVNMLASTLKSWVPQDKLDVLVQILKPEQNQLDDENALKSVEDAIRMGKFFIPDYQRGYRWESKHVKDFLDDIDKVEEGKINCIQPLVVKKITDKDIIKKYLVRGDLYTVIDGQQRLTTLYIILALIFSRLGGSYEDNFKIIIERHGCECLQEFLNNEKKAEEKVDAFHVKLAKDTADKFFENKSCEDLKEFKNKLLKQTKFIWCEIEDENEIETFDRLNTGKISLTDTELIRALLLSRSDKEPRKIQNIQAQIATEWDKFENSLRNSEFWGGIHCGAEYNKYVDATSRISLLFLMLYEEINGNTVFSLYKSIQEEYDKHHQDDDTLKKYVHEKWNKVRDIYYTLNDWYYDFELYHYVGCYASVMKDSRLLKLLNEWKNGQGKKSFIKYIQEEIYNKLTNKLKVDDLSKEEKKNIIKEAMRFNPSIEIKGEDKFINMIINANYENRYLVKDILLCHNVQSALNAWRKNNLNQVKSDSFARFPFHLYHDEDWNIEHIDSRHEYTLSEGYPNDPAKMYLEDIYRRLNAEDIKKEIREILINAKKITVDFIKNCSTLLDNSEHKDWLWNLAILDASTNKEYKNAPFRWKRAIILARTRGEKPKRLIWKDKKDMNGISKEGTLEVENWVPDEKNPMVSQCTLNAFMKSYNPTPSDLSNWGEQDKKSYLRDIVKRLIEFFALDTL
ncbi:MAG: DUF262 domain-containing protein [Akkermansiaceae bacterium]|nr:DUF262 domain-containing protein [Akkermansiaceae bacterium]